MKARTLGAATATLATAASLGGASYFAHLLRRGALDPRIDEGPDHRALVVESVMGDSIALMRGPEARGDEEWAMPGVYGLEWEGGYAQVGPIVMPGELRVRRAFLPRWEMSPPTGQAARLDSFAYPWDPRAAHGYEFRDVLVEGPLGPLPAWIIDGDARRWMLFVHGKGASRREAFRALPAAVAAGFTCLLITYRNDVEAPRSPDGRYNYGATEWEDLAAAADYARGNGASELVLAGYSMGGAIVLSYLRRAGYPDDVRALVLDAPMLDLRETVRFGVGLKGVPRAIAAAGTFAAGFRLHLDWRELDYLADCDRLRAPVLLFHGARDRTVPVATSDRLAARRPDVVEYARTGGADHVRSWNVDPANYEARLEAFLRGHVPGVG